MSPSLVPQAAQAQETAPFVCAPAPETRTEDGTVFTQVWTDSNRCIPFFIQQGAPFLDGDTQWVTESFEQWSQPSCTDLEFFFAGLTDEGIGFDVRSDRNRNVVTVITEPGDLDEFRDAALLAVTFVNFSVETGEIFDADIALNAVVFNFDDVASSSTCRSTADRPFDLRNTLVHEIGHFIGFDHTPDTAATMFESALPCEVLKRDLNETDLAGLCTVYPSGGTAETCSRPSTYALTNGDPSPFRNQCQNTLEDTSGCASLGSSPWMVWSLPWALWAFRKRRRGVIGK